MWQCRLCSANPFGNLFGPPAAGSSRRASAPRPAHPHGSKKRTSGTRREGKVIKEDDFTPRSKEEAAETARQWQLHAHRRAHDFFGSEIELFGVLQDVALCVDRGHDPVLGRSCCAIWQG